MRGSWLCEDAQVPVTFACEVTGTVSSWRMIRDLRLPQGAQVPVTAWVLVWDPCLMSRQGALREPHPYRGRTNAAVTRTWDPR